MQASSLATRSPRAHLRPQHPERPQNRRVSRTAAKSSLGETRAHEFTQLSSPATVPEGTPFWAPALTACTDRLATLAICLAAVAVVLVPCDSALAASASASPWAQSKQTASFGVLNGRLQACPAGVNPNCVSTSSNNDTYAPAWRAKATDARAALLDIEASFLGTQKDATKLIEAETPYGAYAAYSCKGKFSKPDVVEFLVKSDGVTNRAWEGDSAGPLVLYRSIAGDVVYVFPLTQPITDMDMQRKRMRSLRQDLGWSLVGCELVECFDEGDVSFKPF